MVEHVGGVLGPGDRGQPGLLAAEEAEGSLGQPFLAPVVGVWPRQAGGQATGGDRLEVAVECFPEERPKPLQDGSAGGARVQDAGLAIPEDGVMVEPAEPAVGGLGLGAEAGGFLRFLALGLGRVAAGVELGPGLRLNLGISLQQRPGDLVGVDPDREVEGIVHHVLGQVDCQVEHVVAAGPAGGDAIGRIGRPVAAGGVLHGHGEQVVGERQRG